MHADFDELSRIAAGRDSAPAHVGQCARCQAELARIRELRGGLASLKVLPVPPGGFDGARERLAGRRAAAMPRRHPPSRRALPLAAALLALVCGAVLFATRPSPDTARQGGWTPDLPLYAENARLEALLAALPEPRRTRLDSAYTVAALEDRVAFIDDRLTAVALEPNAPEIAEQLWRERLVLMRSLVQVQYARSLAAR